MRRSSTSCAPRSARRRRRVCRNGSHRGVTSFFLRRKTPVTQSSAVPINSALAVGDIERVASFWTEDVTIRRGLGTPVSGRAAYRQLFESTGNRDSALVYLREPTGIEVSPRWPLAFETGTWAGHPGRADGPAVIRGRYSAQWVKRGGRWLIRSEVFVALTCAESGCASEALP